jgi:hypothetical protein
VLSQLAGGGEGGLCLRTPVLAHDRPGSLPGDTCRVCRGSSMPEKKCLPAKGSISRFALGCLDVVGLRRPWQWPRRTFKRLGKADPGISQASSSGGNQSARRGQCGRKAQWDAMGPGPFAEAEDFCLAQEVNRRAESCRCPSHEKGSSLPFAGAPYGSCAFRWNTIIDSLPNAVVAACQIGR